MALPIWLGYVLFVVYGSLVPLDYRPIPFDDAWALFQQTRMFDLGVESRADWIANGVLYVPLGFLGVRVLVERFPASGRVPLHLLAGSFSIALAIAIEFTQLFFPPRSVSLNDLLAESIGTLVGLMLAARHGDWFDRLQTALFGDRLNLVRHLVEAYLLGYIAFSLFPYDVLLSAQELKQKIASDDWGWLLAGAPGGRLLIALKLLAEFVLTLPFGLYLAFRQSREVPSFGSAIFLGLVLGGFMESAQFLTASGVSQGASVLSRVAGCAAGLACWHTRANWSPDRVMLLARRYSLPVLASYVLLLLHVNGWLVAGWRGLDFAVSRIADLHFLPFYYHYYTTEAKALFSLASVCLMYLPIGALAWANRKTPSQAFSYALVTATLVETGKLFLPQMRPDPTNVVLAAAASWAVVRLANLLATAAHDLPGVPTGRSAGPTASTPYQTARPLAAANGRWRSIAIVLPPLAFAASWEANFPTQNVLLCLLLAGCALCVSRAPPLLLAIVPAALPVLDLAPWSGRFFFDEFDLLLGVGLAVAYARTPPVAAASVTKDRLFVAASVLVGVNFAISAVPVLWPVPALDANAFTNYFSPYNALRIAKGAVWALLVCILLRRLSAAATDFERPLAFGMTAGLALTAATVVWERLTFPGLFDFTVNYRVTGPFSSMHTGGAYIECFLAMAMPFVVVLVLQTKSVVNRLLGVLLVVLGAYALMVTFSRGGYLAFALALLLVLALALVTPERRQGRAAIVAVAFAAVLGVAVPALTSPFAQDRFASVGKDLETRQSHWADALAMRSGDGWTRLFGAGLGTYPRSHYLFSREGSRTGTYQLRSEGGNRFLRLAAGDPIYVEQIVGVEPAKSYRLRLDVRSTNPAAAVALSLCEKWLLTSFKCTHQSLRSGELDETRWHTLESRFNSGSIGGSPWYLPRTVKLSLHAPTGNDQIDIDNLRLETPQGKDLLRNADFSRDLDYWFFSAENHLQWHAKSLLVAVLFDQGWFGLIALSLFWFIAIERAARKARCGNLYAAGTLAALAAFLAVGLFDTLIDAPRFLFLALVLAYCGRLHGQVKADRPSHGNRDFAMRSRARRLEAQS